MPLDFDQLKAALQQLAIELAAKRGPYQLQATNVVDAVVLDLFKGTLDPESDQALGMLSYAMSAMPGAVNNGLAATTLIAIIQRDIDAKGYRTSVAAVLGRVISSISSHRPVDRFASMILAAARAALPMSGRRISIQSAASQINKAIKDWLGSHPDEAKELRYSMRLG